MSDLSFVVLASYVAYVGIDVWHMLDQRDARLLDDATERTENDKCALRGLVLLRGQAGEFVCVTPRSERYRRKP